MARTLLGVALVIGAVATPSPRAAFAADPAPPASAEDGQPSAGSPTEADINPDPLAEPALAYMGALVVAAVVLLIVGFVALAATRPRTRPTKPGAGYWACPSCGVRNAPDRSSCFACRAVRTTSSDNPDTPGVT